LGVACGLYELSGVREGDAALPELHHNVIGAHSVPRWYEALDRLVALGQLAEGDFVDAQLRATQAAVVEQEVAGIDVITGGERPSRKISVTGRKRGAKLKLSAFRLNSRPARRIVR
jgi:hypothetical protein